MQPAAGHRPNQTGFGLFRAIPDWDGLQRKKLFGARPRNLHHATGTPMPVIGHPATGVRKSSLNPDKMQLE
jgi:hypothetical protein